MKASRGCPIEILNPFVVTKHKDFVERRLDKRVVTPFDVVELCVRGTALGVHRWGCRRYFLSSFRHNPPPLPRDRVRRENPPGRGRETRVAPQVGKKVPRSYAKGVWGGYPFP